MKLGIMQPYFFPYLGYFHLLASVDLLIVYDIVQFSKGGWVNRNRILGPNNGWKYITVPLERTSFRNHIENSVPIKQVMISVESNWRRHILGQLEHYRRAAPFFSETIAVVQDCLFSNLQSISELNVYSLAQTCKRLGIRFNHRLASELKLDFDPELNAQDRVLQICDHFDASEYINVPGGVNLYDRSKFEAVGINLTIQTPVDFVYGCDGYEFQPNLSIIDVLMWNSPSKIWNYLDSRRLED
jgi:hypothetical protein